MRTVKNLILCVLMLVVVSAAAADTHYVNPGDSIQDGIDAADPGDEIEVAGGIYNEAIDFKGKAIRLYSLIPGDATIDASGLNCPVVTCNTGEGVDTILDGFTITGGNAVNGGGMYNSGSSPTVTDCTFTGNSATGGLVTTWEPGLWYGTLPGNINTTDPNPQMSVTWDLHETEDTDLPENTTEVYTGQIWVALSGDTGFAEHNDDKTRLYIDLNQDGDFEDCELVLSSDDWLDRVEGSATLMAGQWYGFELRMSNGDGPGGIVEAPCFAYRPPGDDWVHPQNTDPDTADLFRCTVITGVESEGGGMYNINSSPTVTGCTFTGNTTTGYGGGMSNNSSSPEVTGCTFESNSAQQAGGMYNDNGSNPTVDACTFSNNTAAGSGGGMRNVESDPIIENCTFTANSGYYAGGLSSINSNPTLTGCSFIDNSADKAAGGLGCYYGTPELTNCTFTGNSAENGGGVNLENGDSPILTNCTFFENSADYGGGLNNWGSSPTVTNCTFTGNTATVNGGGIASDEDSNPTLTNCTFTANHAAGVGGAMVCYSGGSPTVTGCTFSENSADDRGGGMFNQESSPSVDNCSFSDNSAGDKGGGMYNQESSPSVDNCSFSGNSAGDKGGGMYNQESSPALDNCSFSGNSAGDKGGGMYNSYSSPTVTDCTFSGNNGGHSGGGMCNWPSSSPTVTNCNFSGNQADYGGAMRNDSGSNPSITNCSFSSNSADGGGGMHNTNSSLSITNCIFNGNEAWCGGGIFNNESSPKVTNCTFSDNTAVTTGGAMRNHFSSNPSITNCTFSGNSAGRAGGGMYSESFNVSSPTVTNCILWGNMPDEIIDIGMSTTTVSYSDVQGVVWPGPGNINADPLFVDETAGDLRLASASPCVDTGINLPDLPDTDMAGNPRVVDGDEDGTATVDMGAYEFLPKPIHNITQDLRYETIQAAIDEAIGGDQIKVAPGTYYEAIDFQGKAIRLYSTAGPEETTIDGGGAYHVVKCVDGEGEGTTLEGFTITGGNANGGYPDERGGGMLNRDTSPTVINCIFTDNYAAGYGGGMSNNGGSPTVTGCTFEGNSADRFGGMHNGGSDPTVTDCTFSSNTADASGGGMGNTNSSPNVTNCSFTGNSAYNSGGMSSIDSTPVLTNCSFSNNTASNLAGAMGTYYGDPMLTNCTFTGNSAGYGGGAVNFHHSYAPVLTNCTFAENSADYGAGINNWDSTPMMTGCTFTGNIAAVNGGGIANDTASSSTVTNCVLWGDTGGEIAGVATVTYSDVEGGGTDDNNINEDPLFEPGTLRLSAGSPCIDAGDNGAVEVETDLDGNRRITDGGELDDYSVVDMGAYEAPGPVHVPGDFATIQAAIDAAFPGGQIAVAPGDYDESIDFQGKAIHLYSTGGPEDTTIDGGGAPHVVRCVNDEGPDTVLEGFTITGGNADGESWPNERGGGMYNQGSSPTVTNCIFTGNYAAGYGGGMSNNYSNPTVIGCSFEGNSSDNHCGGMHNDYSSPTLINCKFIGNSAVNNGGGIGNTNDSCPTITNCTFTANTGGYGAAISNMGGSNPTVTNCILWGDFGSEIGGPAVVTYSDVEGGWTGDGNIALDPMFADADARLLSGSPCIEAGDNDAVDVTTDLDGNPRIADADLDDDAVVDMGAYEYVWTDADEDGIEDSIDTEPGVHSNGFDDGLISGTILDREDQTVFVSNVPDPCGVRISASGGDTPAQVSAYDGVGETVFMLDAGDAVVVSPGSIHIAVVQGTVEIAFVAADGTQAQTILNEGNGIEFEPETCTITAPSTNSEDVIVIVDGGEIVLSPGDSKLVAKVDIDPNTLNLKSKGAWITCYIELLEDFDVGDIDVGTVTLNGEVQAELAPTTVGDYDGDGVADLMVKFDLAETQALLEAADAVQISVAGQLNDETEFEGCDTIRVIEPGGKKKK